MNDDDFKDACTMLAMVGYLMNGDYSKEEIPALSFELGEAMAEFRKSGGATVGLPPIKSRKRK